MRLTSLAQLAIDAAGGLRRWRQFEAVSARLSNGGVLWPLKRQQGVLYHVRVRVDLRKEWVSHWPFGAPDLRTSFQPRRVAVFGESGAAIGAAGRITSTQTSSRQIQIGIRLNW